MSSSTSCPLANRAPSRTASRMSPNTNRSPTAVPASPARSSGSPLTRPRAKLTSERCTVPASAFSTFSTSAPSSGTPRSRASSTKLRARSTSSAASAASISRAATAASSERATARSASATGSSWAAISDPASKPRGARVTAAIAAATARASGIAILAPVINRPLPSGAARAPPNVVGYDPAGKVPGGKNQAISCRRIPPRPQRFYGKSRDFSNNCSGWLREFLISSLRLTICHGRARQSESVYVLLRARQQARNSGMPELRAWRPRRVNSTWTGERGHDDVNR